jgi:hypothetical protein
MKKALVILLGVLASLPALGQGTVDIATKNNNKGINAPVYDVSLTGTKLDGANYFAQLFGGPTGTPAASMVACGDPVNFRTGAAAGYVNSALVPIPGVDYGGNKADLQLRAWSANGGNTWAAASAKAQTDNAVHTGVSKIITITTASSATDVVGIPGLVGMDPFFIESQVAIPEPSTMALCLLGLAALFIRRRS